MSLTQGVGLCLAVRAGLITYWLRGVNNREPSRALFNKKAKQVFLLRGLSGIGPKLFTVVHMILKKLGQSEL